MSSFGTMFNFLYSLVSGILFGSSSNGNNNVLLYDVIVIGAGAGGCPLVQTLVEHNISVLLLERGPEQVESAKQLSTSIKVLTDKCAESFRSQQGVTVTTGSCMGGATSINHGIYVQEEAEWVQNMTMMPNVDGPILSLDEITKAFDWIRERIAPEPTFEPVNSSSSIYTKQLIDIFKNHSSDFRTTNSTVTNLKGQPTLQLNTMWRTHSTFHPTTERRRSSNTILDRTNPYLSVQTNARVRRILFDSDPLIPDAVAEGISATSQDIPTARCVQLVNNDVICVKDGGRIYLSAGAIHTPHILMNSGIGGDTNNRNSTNVIVSNPNVGQNLVDKPALLLAGSFQPNFDLTEHLSFAHIAATKVDPNTGNTELLEELNNGIDSMYLLAGWQRNFVPVSLRNSWFAAAAAQLIKYCDDHIDKDPTPRLICSPMVPLVRAGCHKNIVGIASLVGQPTSRGSVTVDENGIVRVDVNYLSTEDDLMAFGATVRTTFKIMSSLTTGPSAIQQPCSDREDKECVSQSCPDLIKNYVEYVYNSLRLAMPNQAWRIKRAPASMLYPQFLEPALANRSNTDYDIGTIASDDIFAAHHLAGTASIGTVVDSSKDFQVIGVNGLYVTDASMLPTTTRANPMATIMTLGRISGLKAVEALKLKL